ncbi:MAG: hypothetical protein U9Q67_03095, partial [Patescibacteria group bacterium]|nr:hypothetical protein [Patescibacteria group bacterium]
ASSSTESPHPDIHILDGNFTNSIGIDQVRKLIRTLQFHPYEAPIQVGVIFLADRLTHEAQNSLLKSLEEPGPETKFILTTPHEKSLLPTILSRAHKIYVAEEITGNIQSEDTVGIVSFVSLGIVDKFLEIEALLKKDKDTPGTIRTFLNKLLDLYREKLLNSTRNRDKQEMLQTNQDLKNINKATYFISKNSNKRLALENLILQIEKEH